VSPSATLLQQRNYCPFGAKQHENHWANSSGLCLTVRPVTGPEMVCIKAVIQSAAKAVTHHEDDHKQQQFNRLILNVFLFSLLQLRRLRLF
jgi:hypothetical protein